MTATSQQPDPVRRPASVWVERTGPRRWVGRNDRGALVELGSVTDDGVFAAGELLKVALAGCAGLTADVPLARRLGADYPATITIEGSPDPDEDRFTDFTEQLVVDLSSLDEESRHRVLTVVHRAIEQHCTVSRSVAASAKVHLTISGENTDRITPPLADLEA